ncbi:MAG: restriction endonuclease [Alphaproteobacteria bacterium]|nr:MAG: restriction endonuclease [Alphaproteobacteria bacterium]
MTKRRFVIEEEGLPDLPGMMLATVEALKTVGGSATIGELEEKIAEIEGVSEEEQSLMMTGRNSNRSRLNYYLAWARTFLKRGGALENSRRGVWSLTESGHKITSIDDTRAIYEAVNAEERARAKEKREKNRALREPQKVVVLFKGSGDDEDQRDFDDWKSKLLDVLRSMSPDAFERLAQRLLREAGFTKVEVRGKTGDGGIDGVGVLRVNLVSFQVFFQCKRYKGSVGSSEIRDFRGAMMGRADKGLFITTGSFTSQASDEATRDGATAIDLIDGDRLCDLLKENGLGVQTELVERVQINRSWFEAI